MRSKAEFRALRETAGITQQALADRLGVKILSAQRWERPTYQQQAPQAAWELLDSLVRAQARAVSDCLQEAKSGEVTQLEYWTSGAVYDDLRRDGEPETWTEANATQRAKAQALRMLGYPFEWYDGAESE